MWLWSTSSEAWGRSSLTYKSKILVPSRIFLSNLLKGGIATQTICGEHLAKTRRLWKGKGKVRERISKRN